MSGLTVDDTAWNFTEISELNLIDVELGQDDVEHKIEVVEHRHDLHRSTFTGQRGERHNV